MACERGELTCPSRLSKCQRQRRPGFAPPLPSVQRRSTCVLQRQWLLYEHWSLKNSLFAHYRLERAVDGRVLRLWSSRGMIKQSAPTIVTATGCNTADLADPLPSDLRNGCCTILFRRLGKPARQMARTFSVRPRLLTQPSSEQVGLWCPVFWNSGRERVNDQ